MRISRGRCDLFMARLICFTHVPSMPAPSKTNGCFHCIVEAYIHHLSCNCTVKQTNKQTNAGCLCYEKFCSVSFMFVENRSDNSDTRVTCLCFLNVSGNSLVNYVVNSSV